MTDWYWNKSIMKKLLSFLSAMTLCLSLSAQETRYVDASTLNIIGKAIPTSKPYTRVDTDVYKFENETINDFANYSTGLAVLFKTNSTQLSARWETTGVNAIENMSALSCKGLDLYIKKDGKWISAGVGRPDMKEAPYNNHDAVILKNMDSNMKECMLYLPLYDRVEKLEIGIDENAVIEYLENPFKHRIMFKGSSVAHGLTASRPGMNYISKFGRDNGLYCFNMGYSGQSKLQVEYARYLADAQVDAFVFDTFSNPSAEIIRERFDTFVDIIRRSHPETPMIFMQTERRESRNFDLKREAFEAKKQAAAEEVVRERMKTDKHIYFITSEDFLGHDHEATSDGSHPTDLGFQRMLDVITPQILDILSRYL